jgi:hypothetical protein
LKDFAKSGVASLLHGNRGRAPKNKTSQQLESVVMGLMKERYYDFNMLHALEKINQQLDLNLKRELFRRWCHTAGLVKRHRKRRSKARYRRSRLKQTGIMLQMDGSHHKWFGGIETCLIAIIDDATGEVPYAEFFYGETTAGCLKVLKKVVSVRLMVLC